MELLIAHDAEFNWDGESKNFVALLYLAAKVGFKDIVNFLLGKEADPNRSGSGYDSPLFIAAYYGHADAVRLLVQAGAEITKSTNERKSALYIAYDSADVTRILLENGADVNDVYDNWSALYAAAYFNKTEVVKLYTQHKADLEIEDKFGMAALSIAASNGNTKVVELLLEAGANVNQRS